MTLKFHNPYTIKIETVYGCNRRCDFCAIHTQNIKEIKFVTLDMIKLIAHQIKEFFDGSRIELTLRGEPTLHPKIFEIIKILKGITSSQVMLTSNGIVLTEDMVKKFYEAGLNILLVDCYEKETLELMKKVKTEFEKYSIREKTPYKRYKNKQYLIYNDDVYGEKVIYRNIHNTAGNVDFNKVSKYGLYPLKEPLEKCCVSPFRELVIRHDGIVCLCCNDWKNQCIVGNILKDNIYDIWHTKKLNTIRKLLLNKQRGKVSPCNVCDYNGGYRIGLEKKYFVEK